MEPDCTHTSKHPGAAILIRPSGAFFWILRGIAVVVSGFAFFLQTQMFNALGGSAASWVVLGSSATMLALTLRPKVELRDGALFVRSAVFTRRFPLAGVARVRREGPRTVWLKRWGGALEIEWLSIERSEGQRARLSLVATIVVSSRYFSVLQGERIAELENALGG